MKKNINNSFTKSLIFLFAILMLLVFTGCEDKDKCDGIHHTEGEWQVVTEATCTVAGERQKLCTVCGEVIYSEPIAVTEHVLVTDSAVAPTCTETGLTEGSHCQVCDTILTKQEVVNALEHNYVLDTTASSNTELVYKCSRCSDTYSIENTHGDICSEHESSDWIVTTEATCSSAGSKHKVCNVCGVELEIESVASLPHTVVVDSAVDATCGHTGLTEGSHCSVCNKVLVEQTVIETIDHIFTITGSLSPTKDTEGYIEYTCLVCEETKQKVLSKLTDYDDTKETSILLTDSNIIVSNDNGGVVVNGSDIVIILGGEYSFSGELSDGSITCRVSEEDKVTINLDGVELACSYANSIYIESGDKVEISAKSKTINYVTDNRTSSTEDASGAAIYSEIDLELKGKGELIINSEYNNGIATKDDLEIKNLTLTVTAPNNALKGNDSLTIESGTIKAISVSGDALKTENSDISSKGNQRGTITINDGQIELYAACDGIDAAYDVVINGGNIEIYTEKNSEYSGDVTVTSSSKMYLRTSTRISLLTTYKYAGLFTLADGTTVWKTYTYTQSGQNRYFEGESVSNAVYVKFYIYSSTQQVGQTDEYLFTSDQLTIPTSFDTFYISSANSSTKKISGSWTNYSTSQSGGGPWGGGFGGMQDGNDESSLYSCKGIKADNEVTISGGTIVIEAHDDAIHANSDTLLETGSYGNGNVTITGGEITCTTDDDGIHADGTLSIEGGNIIVLDSYEAIEGNYIYFKGGTTQVKASDDGINAKTSLTISGGVLYLDANGDGLDSNGTITMTGGVVLAIGPTNGGNGVLDFDRSFTFSGGLLLAIGASGMNQKPTAQSGNTSTTKSISTNTSSYVQVVQNSEVIAVIKVTKSSQNYCVLAYNNTTYGSLSVSVSTSNSKTLVNNLYYVK